MDPPVSGHGGSAAYRTGYFVGVLLVGLLVVLVPIGVVVAALLARASNRDPRGRR